VSDNTPSDDVAEATVVPLKRPGISDDGPAGGTTELTPVEWLALLDCISDGFKVIIESPSGERVVLIDEGQLAELRRQAAEREPQ
jgi:hypothetical protein